MKSDIRQDERPLEKFDRLKWVSMRQQADKLISKFKSKSTSCWEMAVSQKLACVRFTVRSCEINQKFRIPQKYKVRTVTTNVPVN